MRTRISLRQGLGRAAILLVIFGCLLAGVSIFAQGAKGASDVSNPVSALPSTTIVDAGISGSDLGKALLTTRVEISGQEEFEFAIEDDMSVEMGRPEVQERIGAIDRGVVRPKDISKAALETRPNISSPLLE